MIEKDELKPLLEKEAETNWLLITSGVFLALSVFLSVTSFLDILRIAADDSIPLVVCPKTYELDAPVLMPTISDAKAQEKDMWIKGFLRRYMQAQFPRSGQDAESSLKYLAAHSKGELKSKYEGFLENVKEFKILIDQGYYFAFYPTNSLDVRIRSTGSAGEWVVEMDGFMIRYAGDKEKRTTPTLRYTVKALYHTMDNPEGLYVTDSNVMEIADYVSGRKGVE